MSRPYTISKVKLTIERFHRLMATGKSCHWTKQALQATEEKQNWARGQYPAKN
jgi:hypothetical protein